MIEYIGIEEVKTYKAFIYVNGTKIYVGECGTAMGAAKLHDKRTIEHNGEECCITNELLGKFDN